jgi:protein-disulfide isomerase
MSLPVGPCHASPGVTCARTDVVMGKSKAADRRMLAVQPDDHVTGASNASMTVIAYCDFECPYCGRAYHVVTRLMGRFGDRLQFVFRHFPLTDKHPFAQEAAEFSEAAAAQGRFWPMHNFLFAYQDSRDTDDVYNFAAKIGLDVDRMRQEMADHVYADRVQRDVEGGRRLGVDGTPTFFLNNERYTDEDRIEHLIQRAA